MGSSQSKKPEKQFTNEEILNNISKLFGSIENEKPPTQYTYNLSSASEGGGISPPRNRYAEIKDNINKQLETMKFTQHGGNFMAATSLASLGCTQ